MRVALTAGLLAVLLVAASAPAANAKPRPNIVQIVTDDQTLASYERRTMPATRRLLGTRGTTFRQAIVTTPLCCPSRATTLTGQYGHNNGVLRNTYAALRDKSNVLPAWLRRAGYKTIHVGKFMNHYADAALSPAEVAPGWDQWHSVVVPRYYNYELQVNGGTVAMGADAAAYLGRVIDERSREMAARFAPKRRPFYMQVDHYAPHISVGDVTGRCENGAVPDPDDLDRFAGEPLPQPPNFNEEDLSDKPSFMRKLPPIDEGSAAGLRELHGCALASLASVDRNVAGIYRELRRAGELDRTVFIFVSDNGFFQGEHRIPVSKQNPYEEGLRVPLVIRAPRELIRRQPKRVRLPVANIDLAPTILHFARAEPCASDRRSDCRTLDGRSLVPLLRGREDVWPEDRAIVVELTRGKSPVESDGRACDYTGVRTTRAVLIEHRAAIDPDAGGECVRLLPGPEYELYDLAADPFQLHNQHSSVTGTPPGELEFDLAHRLVRLADCRGIKGRDARPDRGRTWCE